MENVIMMRTLARADRFDKRTHKILLSAYEILSILLTKIKKRGEGIVEPPHLLEDITAIMNEATSASINKDFIELLISIREAVVLHFGVAFALHLGDENWEFVLVSDDSLDVVETLAMSDYSKYRWESMSGNGSGEAEKFLPHVEESLEIVMQNVAESTGVVLQPVEGSSGRRHSKGKKIPSVIKKIKQ